MSRVLHIKATPRDEQSRSMRLARAFIDTYKTAHPNDTIETLDVFAEDIPEFDALAAEGKYRVMRLQEHQGEEADRWQKVVAAAEHFKAFDKYVITAPMWNLSVPYRLKLYIDTIVQPSLTFGYDEERGYFGLVGDKPVLILGTRGGDYSPESGFGDFDFHLPYLKTILGLMGLVNVEALIAQPMDLTTPEHVERILGAMEEQARQVATSF